MIQGPNNLATLTTENISQSYVHETLFASNILARHSYEEVRDAIGVHVPQAGNGRAHSPIFLGRRIGEGKDYCAIFAAEDKSLACVNEISPASRVGIMARHASEKIANAIAVEVRNRRHGCAQLSAEMLLLNPLKFRVGQLIENRQIGAIEKEDFSDVLRPAVGAISRIEITILKRSSDSQVGNAIAV
jgi:hypothetical protein